MQIPLSLVLVLALTSAVPALAAQTSPLKMPADSYLVAQTDPDEAFDPFSDYSEFDEASDEEADVNFFRNGRFFTVGIEGGMRGYTGNFSKIYGSAPSYGLTLSYFFDLRLALAMGFKTGDASVNILTANQAYTGNVSITTLNFDLKYYLNTQNVTRGLADLNPYLLGGLAQFSRTYTLSGLEGYSRDSAMGVDIGLGLEVPLLRRKAYLGVQGVYHYVSFSDENKGFINDGTSSVPLTTTISGDVYDLSLILGMNF
ncbi:MAG: hypothetical protein EOP06_19850 [Proteobacteria bacterium]|nr:MAG: hypothetical protein EOP06_19850 [Pseudomonadota bacterium]